MLIIINKLKHKFIFRDFTKLEYSKVYSNPFLPLDLCKYVRIVPLMHKSQQSDSDSVLLESLLQ